MPVSVLGLVGPMGQLLSKSSALGSNAATFHHHHHPRDNSCPDDETRPGHPQSQVLDMPPPLPASFSPQCHHRTTCLSHLQVSRAKELRTIWVYFLLEILPPVPDELPFLLIKPQEYEKPSNFPFHLRNSSENLSHFLASPIMCRHKWLQVLLGKQEGQQISLSPMIRMQQQ